MARLRWVCFLGTLARFDSAFVAHSLGRTLPSILPTHLSLLNILIPLPSSILLSSFSPSLSVPLLSSLPCLLSRFSSHPTPLLSSHLLFSLARSLSLLLSAIDIRLVAEGAGVMVSSRKADNVNSTVEVHRAALSRCDVATRCPVLTACMNQLRPFLCRVTQALCDVRC